MPVAAANPVRRALMTSVLSGIYGQAAVIVSGTVLARMLGVESRGNFALLTVLPLILGQFGGLGLPVAATFEIAREPTIARPLLRRLSRFIGIQTILLTLLHGVILVSIMGERGPDVQIAAVFTILLVPAFFALVYGLAVMQGQQRYREFNVLRVAPVIVNAAVALAIFLAGVGTLPLLVASYTATWLILGVVTLVLAVRGAGPPKGAGRSLPPTGRLVKFGARSLLGSVSPSDGVGIDQAAVGLMLSTRALGLYVVAGSFMNLSRFVTQSIGLVAYPNVAGRRDPGDAVRAMWRFTAIGVVAAGAIAGVLEVAVGGLIEFFFGSSFSAAVGPARLLLIAAFFLGARRVLSDAARGADRPLVGTAAEIVSWAVLIPSIAILAPLLGLDGVAIALAIASVASLSVVVVGVRRSPRQIRPEPPAAGLATQFPDVAGIE